MFYVSFKSGKWGKTFLKIAFKKNIVLYRILLFNQNIYQKRLNKIGKSNGSNGSWFLYISLSWCVVNSDYLVNLSPHYVSGLTLK